MVKYSLCIDLLYLEIGEHGPIFSDTEKLLAGMELAKKTGYHAVEFWDWAGRDYERLIAKKQELGLDVVAICAKDRGTLIDPSTYDKAIEGLKETIKVAKKFECPNIIYVPGGNPQTDRKSGHANIVAGLKKLAPYVEEAGLTLVLEPIVGEYFTDSKEAFEVLKEVGSPNVKLLYDIFHYQTMEGNVVSVMRDNMDLIGHIHAASVPGRNEITDGELDYGYILKAIKESGYDRYFGVEYMPTMDKEESVTKCKELIEKALA